MCNKVVKFLSAAARKDKKLVILKRRTSIWWSVKMIYFKTGPLLRIDIYKRIVRASGGSQSRYRRYPCLQWLAEQKKRFGHQIASSCQDNRSGKPFCVKDVKIHLPCVQFHSDQGSPPHQSCFKLGYFGTSHSHVSSTVDFENSYKLYASVKQHNIFLPFQNLFRNQSKINSSCLSILQRPVSCYSVDSHLGRYRYLSNRSIVTSCIRCEPKSNKSSKPKIDDEKSKVEEAVEAIKEKKEKLKEKAFESYCAPEDLEPKVPAVIPKKPLLIRIKDEVIHYYNGFKLLYYDCKIAVRMLWQVMNGKSLTRRERRQFLRTASDLFRLVPFLVFIVIPFMEFLLPVAIRLFPNMLPSTFEDKSKKEETKKKQLKLKIQMAKFLQDTVEEMAVAAKKKKTQEAVVEFATFFEKIRAKGEQPSNEDILRFSKLFEDEITLDNMNRAQLKAINGLLTLPTYGTNNYLRFQLKMRLRQLRTDDLMIKKEGVDTLTVQEVQSACQSRGMRAIGVPEARLRSQLKQWIELHLQEQIPASLLLMSRAMYLPETVGKVDQLKEVLSTLPEQIVEETEIKVAEAAGEVVDNKTRLDVLKNEEMRIAEENEERIMQKIEEVAAAVASGETLVDKAEAVSSVTQKEDISKDDLLSIKETLCSDREREELERIKEDREEYQEDVRELAIEDKDKILTESVGSVRLGKKVDKMIKQIEKRLEADPLAAQDRLKIDADGDGKISIEEMISAVMRMNNAPSESKCRRIAEMLDQDKDGAVDLNDIDKVAELLASEDVDLAPSQIAEIVELVKMENEFLETETEVEQKEAEITRKLEQWDLDLGEKKKADGQI